MASQVQVQVEETNFSSIIGQRGQTVRIPSLSQRQSENALSQSVYQMLTF